MGYAIQTNQLTKSYNGLKAVDQVSISIKKGTIYGFLGLNGAGKTTMIRMLLGMIKPSEGSCYIDGKQVVQANPSIWEKVGYMVETPRAYPELTVKENLEIFRRLRLVENKQAVHNVCEQLKLTAYVNKKAKHLSLGNAQRLGIAKALLHQPEILILDEPVNGLDPAGIVEVRELLLDLAENHGITIFISSHLLSEISKTVSQIGIIHEGKLVDEVKAKQLNRLLKERLVIHTRHNAAAGRLLSESGYSWQQNKEGLIESYQPEAIKKPENIARLLTEHQLPPVRLTVEEEDLEAYFLRVITGKGVEQLHGIL
ncbi:ABC transporter ATP-binding protein [Halobacillus salinarum]|uniref:ABC transporter ATP-binding protein n=1 Tax=Halobacillus salinarum TaxID=2932257 RepID=A0ABY4EGR9_9BACI|nr:ABC transporter ATP-binding protein [Halobacillus salinarum]UOQ43635.1 ABC transporter ATP-binding protein [Halobacillus salinarum]